MAKPTPLDRALFDACELDADRSRDQIQDLLDQGANPNTLHWGYYNSWVSPLMALVQQRNPDPEPEIIELLLARGAAPSLANPRGQTALHIAARFNYPRLCAQLLAHGADPNLVFDGSSGGTPLHSTVSVHRDKSLATIEILLSQGADPNLRHDGQTPLHHALDEGAWKAAAFLLDHAARPDHDLPGKYHSGGGSLVAAMRSHAEGSPRPEQLRWLVIRGANPNHRDGRGDTALLTAASRHPDLIPLLISLGAAPEQRNATGRTVLLQHIADSGSAAGVQALLAAGPELDVQDAEGKTALWHAVDTQQEGTVQALLAAGADPQIADQQGKRPLDLAQDRGLSLIARHLSTSGGPPVGSWVAILLDAIEAGRVLKLGEEQIARGYISSEGQVFFKHRHPGYHHFRTTRTRDRPWIEERLAWLCLHHGLPICTYLTEIAPVLGIEAPSPQQLVASLEAQEADLLQRARLSLEGVDLGDVLARGLWAGASFYSADKEGMESWSRHGDQLLCETDGYTGKQRRTLSLEQTRAEWASWGQRVDGFVFRPYSHFSGALSKALSALGHPTLRALLVAEARD